MSMHKKNLRSASNARRGGPGKTVRLRPANPFDLIRLIAHSQSDPRKALAELVQNSLEAGAGHVTVSRLRRGDEVAISVLDDGSGVFPELDRPAALERIATNIGHSFKRNLSPLERQKAMVLGQYGIGILGFWAVGEELEMRTRVAGSEVWALRLHRDKPTAEVFPVRQRRIHFPGETWTEVAILRVRSGSARQLVGRRLGDYLGAELRGQLLERKVRLRILDRLARGKAVKDFLVVPRRFRGRRIQELGDLAVPGYSHARLEIYVVGVHDGNAEKGSEQVEDGDGCRPRVSLTCGGAVVCDDIARVEGYDMDRSPWSLGCLEGVVEFPGLEVTPTSRRGFTPGPAPEVLFQALRSVEPMLLEAIAAERERRRSEDDRDLARQIRKVFRPIARALPQYDFFEIRREGTPQREAPEEEGAMLGRSGGLEGDAGVADASAAGEGEPPTSEVVEEGDASERAAEILPPGSLAEVLVVPRRSRLLPGASRKLRAKALDGDGRLVTEGVEFEWIVADGPGSLSPGGAKVPEGAEAIYHAPEEIGAAVVRVVGRQGTIHAEGQASLEIVETLSGDRADAGIPDPQRVYDPSGDWRSRVAGRRWEYNAAHPDYQSVVEDSKRRFRYLVHLFVKEIVLRNYGESKDERLLERMVEVLTHIQPRV